MRNIRLILPLVLFAQYVILSCVVWNACWKFHERGDMGAMLQLLEHWPYVFVLLLTLALKSFLDFLCISNRQYTEDLKTWKEQADREKGKKP